MSRLAGSRGMLGPWHGATPVLVVGGVLVLVLAVAGYVMAGWPGLSAVTVTEAAAVAAGLRCLLPPAPPDRVRTRREKQQARMMTGYTQRRYVVKTATDSLGFYHSELRPLLEQLLAARLAERHGVHLYTQPEIARRLFCPAPGDADLWRWIAPDPQGQNGPAGQKNPADPRGRPPTAAVLSTAKGQGIPKRTLVRLIDRLENV